MKFAQLLLDQKPTLAVAWKEGWIPISVLLPNHSADILTFLDENSAVREALAKQLLRCTSLPAQAIPKEQAHYLAPILQPGSFRDAYAFRQHVETSRRNRGLEMIPTFDEIPVFYFSNHRAIQGPGPVAVEAQHLRQLDYELEVAIVIGKEGKNIRAAEADAYIAGMMILNDLSARALQMQEMKLNLGPAKGKDFASMFGPYLVTMDELSAFEVAPQKGHVGKAYSLDMKAYINGTLYSHGNLSDMHWTFAEIIERASYGVTLYPGDIIGSGTVGTGCLLELNGTARLHNPEHKERWLQLGDEITLKVEALGQLTNTIIEA
jgi:fumarylacetoacetate (FAA) hydrolase